MDKLEIQRTVTVKNLDISFLLGLKLLAVGMAIDTYNNDEYYISISIGLFVLHFNFCLTKPKQ